MSAIRKASLTRSYPFPTTPLPEHVLNNLRNWITCIAIVHFDLDVGPDLDNVYPPTTFTSEEQAAIAFSSFPDSTAHTSTGSTSQTFSWRIRRSCSKSSATSLSSDAPELCGYCYFAQNKVESSHRGYVQQSLAIITPLSEYVGFFSSLMNVLGPMYNSSDNPPAVIEAAVNEIASWDRLQAPSHLSLPFLGTVQTVDFPQSNYFQAHHELVPTSKVSSKPVSINASIPSNILATNPIPPLSWLFRDNIPRLWLLWELVVLGEPLLIFAPSDPSRCSAFVHWARSLIRPIPSAGEWRPYFHVHSPDFSILANSSKPPPGVILGCTNPLILSACKQWPHIVRLSISNSTDDNGVPAPSRHSITSKTESSHSYRAAQESNNGLFSTRVRHVRRDHETVQAVNAAIKRGDFFAADAILIESFAQLTQRFLAPLERYFVSLLPPSTASSYALNPQISTKPFNQADFLEFLRNERRAAGSDTIHLPLRRSRITSKAQVNSNFYERFLRSGNFALWLDQRMKATSSAHREQYMDRLKKAGSTPELLANPNRNNKFVDTSSTSYQNEQTDPLTADLGDRRWLHGQRKRDYGIGTSPRNSTGSNMGFYHSRHKSSASKSTIDFSNLGVGSRNDYHHQQHQHQHQHQLPNLHDHNASGQGRMTKIWSAQAERLRAFRRTSEDLTAAFMSRATTTS